MSLDRSSLSKVIHCILPAGRASDLIERLREERGIECVFSHHARGGGISSKKGQESFHYLERDIVTLLAPAERADDIFEFAYRAAGVDQPHSGMVLMEGCLLGGPAVAVDGGEGASATPAPPLQAEK